jgi:hypothetical protein
LSDLLLIMIFVGFGQVAMTQLYLTLANQCCQEANVKKYRTIFFLVLSKRCMQIPIALCAPQALFE